jgi:hypothetical protein
MLRASSLISRMTTSAAPSARVADVASGSTARRAPSDPTPCPLPCAALWAAPLSTPPRSPCNNEPNDTRQELLAISGGMSWRSGLRQRRPPLDVSGDRARSKSSVCAPSSARMTRVHPTPARGRPLPPVSGRGRATGLPFFEPSRDGVARDSEGAREAAQTAALVVGAKYLFALFRRVSVSARLFSTALRAIAAQIPLAAIRSEAVTHQPFALAMLTSQSKGDHD